MIVMFLDLVFGKVSENLGSLRLYIVIEVKEGRLLVSENSIRSLLVKVLNDWVSMRVDKLFDQVEGDTVIHLKNFVSVIKLSKQY